MALLEIMLDSKIYSIGCGENEKDYFRKIAQELNKKIKKLRLQNKTLETATTEQIFLYQLLILEGENQLLRKKKEKHKTSDLLSPISEKEMELLQKITIELKRNSKILDNLVK